MDLNSHLDNVKGVGPKIAKELRLSSLNTINDLIEFLPRTYDDYSNLQQIKDIRPGKVTIRAKCESITTKPVRRGLRVTTATLVDDSSKLIAVWFNQPYRATQLKPGVWFYFSGEFELNYGRYQLTNPSAEQSDGVHVNSGRIVPEYRAVKGIKSALIRKLLTTIRPLFNNITETMPISVVKTEGLLSRAVALEYIHFPSSIDDVDKARERLGYEEIFYLLMASRLNKLANARQIGHAIPFQQNTIKDFVGKLPFKLTNAQRQASWSILQDMEKPTPMNRMLQGDVGSGKTVVAGLAACQVASHGMQTVLMAPTEILASQHAETLNKLLTPLGFTVGLLTGSVKGKSRASLLEQVSKGNVDVVVGTHALIQDGVKYHQLGLVIIDEQHRFGVKQRQKLSEAAGHMPHLLTMTATPIPRSLALTLYGELDISVLDELPAGRKPIKTKICSPNSKDALYRDVDTQLESGRQAYIVCSLIDENTDNDLKSVQAEYVRLQNSVFKHRRIGLMHGKLKSSEKDAVMTSFLNHELDILVSTTVVEVGVDVPNATVIVIEDADRFGLSQLHQLRGRVGRSVHQSYCYLVTSGSQKPSKRLQEIEKSNDGFYLAEADLKLRGPGEIYGKSQHGALNLKVASLADAKLISRVSHQVDSFIASNPDMLQYKQLATQVRYYQRLTTLN